MGIFDIFKKKKTASTFPENELEKTLMQATTDASARHEFYLKLLWNELIVLTIGHDNSQEGYRTLEKDTKIQFVTFENGKIPVFTSTNRIFDKGVINEEVPFIALKGQSLFSLTKGATFILNPYSDYGKELVPNEIENLLDGSIFDQNNEMTIEKETEVQIGQPANYPIDIEDDMSSITNEAGPLAEKFMKNEIVDFIQIDNKGGISDYFIGKTIPFYKRN